MKLLLIFGFLSVTFGNKINYDLLLINEYFNINYDDNNIILNNYDISNVKINFEYIAEVSNDEEYNKQNIIFNRFIKDTDDFNNFNYVKTSMKTEQLYFEINYEAIYNKNYVDVVMFIKNKASTSTNNIVICISFDKEIINYNGKYILEVKDYIINFSNISFSDYKYYKVNVERFGNYFYIYFPSYKDFIHYKFILIY